MINSISQQTITRATALLSGAAILIMIVVLWIIYGSDQRVTVIFFGPEIYFLLVGNAIVARAPWGQRQGHRALTLLLCLGLGGALAGPTLWALGRISAAVGALAMLICGAAAFFSAKLRAPFYALTSEQYQNRAPRRVLMLGGSLVVSAYLAAVLYGFGGLLSRLGG